MRFQRNLGVCRVAFGPLCRLSFKQPLVSRTNVLKQIEVIE